MYSESDQDYSFVIANYDFIKNKKLIEFKLCYLKGQGDYYFISLYPIYIFIYAFNHHFFF